MILKHLFKLGDDGWVHALDCHELDNGRFVINQKAALRGLTGPLGNGAMRTDTIRRTVAQRSGIGLCASRRRHAKSEQGGAIKENLAIIEDAQGLDKPAREDAEWIDAEVGIDSHESLDAAQKNALCPWQTLYSLLDCRITEID